MDILESIGFIHFWGLSPAINFLAAKPKSDTLNVLLTGTSDIRHIMQTISDNCQGDETKYKQINIYIHEKQKQVFARMLLFLDVIQSTHLNYRERIDLYLDLFGNMFLTEKSNQYLNSIIPNLLNVISEDKQGKKPLTQLVSFEQVKFQQRDELMDIVKSWSSMVPFNMEKMLDQRLRYHYKERYDYRQNLIDWDYHMGIKQYASIIHFTHYRDWRNSGIAFEQRFRTYIIPNRTLSSYLPGKKKLTHESCLVRGYWGDIMLSPYLSIGIETDYPEQPKLFKICNKEHIGSAYEVSEFHLQYFFQMMETLTTYRHVFTDEYRREGREEMLKKEDEKRRAEEQRENNKENGDIQQEADKEDEEQRLEREEEEEQKRKQQIEKEAASTKETQLNGSNSTEQVKEGQRKKQQIREPQEQIEQEVEEGEIVKKQNNSADDTEAETSASDASTIDVSKAVEETKKQKSVTNDFELVNKNGPHLKPEQSIKNKNLEYVENDLLKSFQKMNVKIIPIFEEPTKLASQQQFQNLFDVVVVGFIYSAYLQDPLFNGIVKPGGTIFAENAHYISPLKKEERINLNNTLISLGNEKGLKLVDFKKPHHVQFTKPEQ